MHTTTLIGLVATSIAAALVAGLLVVAKQRDQLKIEAIKHGAAEWIVDEAGQTTFQWKAITNN